MGDRESLVIHHVDWSRHQLLLDAIRAERESAGALEAALLSLDLQPVARDAEVLRRYAGQNDDFARNERRLAELRSDPRRHAGAVGQALRTPSRKWIDVDAPAWITRQLLTLAYVRNDLPDGGDTDVSYAWGPSDLLREWVDPRCREPEDVDVAWEPSAEDLERWRGAGMGALNRALTVVNATPFGGWLDPPEVADIAGALERVNLAAFPFGHRDELDHYGELVNRGRGDALDETLRTALLDLRKTYRRATAARYGLRIDYRFR